MPAAAGNAVAPGPRRCILSSVTSRFPAVLVLALLLAPLAWAQKVNERQALELLVARPELSLPAATQTTEHAMTRLHFWVDKDGEVEAVEMVCGERALFDEIVDAALELLFRKGGNAFVTDLSFERQGRRVLFYLDLPEAQRHRASDCLQEGKPPSRK